jgi:hypothetical protein
MRGALGVERPFDRPMVLAWLGMAAVSTLSAVAAWSGSTMAFGAAGVLAVILIAGVIRWTFRARSMRGTAPVTWREVRTVATAKLTAGPVLAVMLHWFWRLGLPVTFVVAFAAVCIGLATLLWAASGPTRRVGFGFAGPLLVFGAVAPLVPAQRILLAAAVTGVVAGLACGAILWVDIRLRSRAVR